MKQFLKKKQNLIILGICLVLIAVVVIITRINNMSNITNDAHTEDDSKKNTYVNDFININSDINETSTIAYEDLTNELTSTKSNLSVTLPTSSEKESTTKKTSTALTTSNTTTTNNNSALPPRDLESEYINKTADLRHEYLLRKNDIEIQRDNAIINNKNREQSLSAEISRLQIQCNQEKNAVQQEINELNKKKMEADMMASTNSYYATLSQQYANQIASKQAQLNNIESKYGAKIKPLKNELDSLPTTEEIKAQATADLNALEIWYANEQEKLDREYGK